MAAVATAAAVESRLLPWQHLAPGRPRLLCSVARCGGRKAHLASRCRGSQRRVPGRVAAKPDTGGSANRQRADSRTCSHLKDSVCKRPVTALTWPSFSCLTQPQTQAPAQHESLTPPPATPPYLQQQRPNVFQYCSPFAAASEAATVAAGPQQRQHQRRPLQPSTAAGRLQRAPPTLGRRTGPTLGRTPTAAAAAAAEAAGMLPIVPEQPASTAAQSECGETRATAAVAADEPATRLSVATDMGRTAESCDESTAGGAASIVSASLQGVPASSGSTHTSNGGSPPSSAAASASAALPLSSQQELPPLQPIVAAPPPAAGPPPPGCNPFLEMSGRGWHE